jgi:hypothetical protein
MIGVYLNFCLFITSLVLVYLAGRLSQRAFKAYEDSTKLYREAEHLMRRHRDTMRYNKRALEIIDLFNKGDVETAIAKLDEMRHLS